MAEPKYPDAQQPDRERRSQTLIREAERLRPEFFRQEIAKYVTPDGYGRVVDPSFFRFRPPYPNSGELNCWGCERGLPWHFTIRTPGPDGKPLLLDAHCCDGPGA